MQAALRLAKISSRQSTAAPSTTSFVQRSYVVGKIRAKPRDDEAEPSLMEEIEEEEAVPSEWTRAHFSAEQLNELADDKTMEIEKRMEALIHRDQAYGDAYASMKRGTHITPENIKTDIADPHELFDSQFGMDRDIRLVERHQLFKMSQKNGMPVLKNKPRFRSGIPTMIDPVGETFAKFKKQTNFYNKNPYRYANAENLIENKESRDEMSRIIKQQLQKQSTEARSSADQWLEEDMDMRNYLSKASVAEAARIEAITSGATADEIEAVVNSFTQERTKSTLLDNDDLDSYLASQENADESEEGESVQVLDSLTFWNNNKQFKERKFDNFDLNLPVAPELYSLTAPRNITEGELNKLYVINSGDYNTFFGELGFGGELDKVFERVAQRALMIREPVLPAVDLLTRMKANNGKRTDLNQRGFVFTGIRGGGKTACLSIVAHHAFKNDFLVFYIPSAHHWTHGPHYVEPSVLLKGYFDVPTPSLAFLRQFSKANSKILKKMKLSKSFNLPVELGEKQPTNLQELIQFGVVSEDNASIAFKLLMDELVVNNDVPMAFIVDDYNFFMDTTGFSYGNLAEFDTKMPEPVHATQLTIVRGLNRLLLQNSPNKVFVAAASNKWKQQNETRLEDYPLEVLNVPRYSEVEMGTMLDYYFSAYYIEGVAAHTAEDLLYLTGAVPSALFNELSVYH